MELDRVDDNVCYKRSAKRYHKFVLWASFHRPPVGPSTYVVVQHSTDGSVMPTVKRVKSGVLISSPKSAARKKIVQIFSATRNRK